MLGFPATVHVEATASLGEGGASSADNATGLATAATSLCAVWRHCRRLKSDSESKKEKRKKKRGGGGGTCRAWPHGVQIVGTVRESPGRGSPYGLVSF